MEFWWERGDVEKARGVRWFTVCAYRFVKRVSDRTDFQNRFEPEVLCALLKKEFSGFQICGFLNSQTLSDRPFSLQSLGFDGAEHSGNPIYGQTE
jgi:hypothetical protein